MGYEIGTATDHYDLLAKFRTFVEVTLPVADQWVSLRVDDTTADHESIWKLPGLSGAEEIFVGIKTYQDVANDYYNFAIMGATGYVSSNTFETQPGITRDGVPLWNQSIPYWFIVNAQRAIIVAKIENVYVSFYIGKFLPYATPTQFPYPICVGGMLGSASNTRYSDPNYVSWFKGSRSSFKFRFIDGTWKQPDLSPFVTGTTFRNTTTDTTQATGYYNLTPLIIMDSSNIYGELDNVYHITGYNNAVENTVTINGVTYVIFRDVARTGFNDYMAVGLI